MIQIAILISMILSFFLVGIHGADEQITLKVVGTDKFLGVTGDRFGPVNYHNALRIKLNTMDDISLKNLETNDNKAMTETGFWFFPKNYGLQKNKKKSSQSFRLVYYAPEEYLLMKGDNCLGFNSSNHLKRKSCKIGAAARFKICYSKFCESYFDIKRDLQCFTNMIGQTIHQLTFANDPDRNVDYSNKKPYYPFYNNSFPPNNALPNRFDRTQNKMEESSDSDESRNNLCKSYFNKLQGLSNYGFTKPNFAGMPNHFTPMGNMMYNQSMPGFFNNNNRPMKYC